MMEICNRINKPYKEFSNNCETRWDSDFLQIKRYLEMRDVVSIFFYELDEDDVLYEHKLEKKGILLYKAYYLNSF